MIPTTDEPERPCLEHDVTINTQSMSSLAEVRAFLDDGTEVSFSPPPHERHTWLAATLHQFHYTTLKRADKSLYVTPPGRYHHSVRGRGGAHQRGISSFPPCGQTMEAFPFLIRGFHSNNGSEYINYPLAAMLDKLRIEFTKSRSRHTSDNTLIEPKNVSVVRQHLGYSHVPARHTQIVNTFLSRSLTPYLNYHRPCFFPSNSR